MVIPLLAVAHCNFSSWGKAVEGLLEDSSADVWLFSELHCCNIYREKKRLVASGRESVLHADVPTLEIEEARLGTPHRPLEGQDKASRLQHRRHSWDLAAPRAAVPAACGGQAPGGRLAAPATMLTPRSPWDCVTADCRLRTPGQAMRLPLSGPGRRERLAGWHRCGARAYGLACA